MKKQSVEDEVMALVDKAVAYVSANGKEKAFAEFSNRKGKFVDGDLYIFVIDFKGVTLAHGDQQYIGKDTIGLKDVEEKPFIKNFIEVAKTKGSGWVDYKWPNPVTKRIENKKAYVRKVDNYLIGCGAFI